MFVEYEVQDTFPLHFLGWHFQQLFDGHREGPSVPMPIRAFGEVVALLNSD